MLTSPVVLRCSSLAGFLNVVDVMKALLDTTSRTMTINFSIAVGIVS